MFEKIRNRLKLYFRMRFFAYLYLNYFCRRVVRKDSSRILPYKGSVIKIASDAKLILEKGNVEFGDGRLSGSKETCILHLKEHSVWESTGGCVISHGCTVQLNPAAQLISGYFTANTETVIICNHRISIGSDAMLGRHVLIYDSDYHSVLDAEGKLANPDSPVQIGNHVWLATGVVVLKGTSIEDNCMVGANTTVHGTVPAGSMCYTGAGMQLRKNYGTWNRQQPRL